VAVLRFDKPAALKVFAKYWRQRTPTVEEPYEFAAKSVELNPRVEPETVRTVLNWMSASDGALEKFYDNSVADELAKEGFLARLNKRVIAREH
jgi:hypothetical protein